jgi:DNA-binding IclR family transcriptional regulator
MQYMLRNTQQERSGHVEPAKPSVQSLDRGLMILEAVARSPQPVRLADMAALLGVDRSSAFRLAGTLRRRGFLTWTAGRKDYILGPAIWRLSRQYDWSGALVKISHEELQLLARVTGETAHVAVQESKHALFIDHVTTNHVIAVSGQTGERVPLHSTAHGKALLADFDRPALEALFGGRGLEAYTRQTIVSLDRLEQVCAQIRTEGYATDDGEYGEGIRCVASPIRDQDGAVVGSIGISAPLSRFPDERYRSSGAEVLAAAMKISWILGNPKDDASADAANGSCQPRRKRDTRDGS